MTRDTYHVDSRQFCDDRWSKVSYDDKVGYACTNVESNNTGGGGGEREREREREREWAGDSTEEGEGERKVDHR